MAMSTYNQSSLPGPWQPEGSGRKPASARWGRPPVAPPDLFRRRLLAIVVLGLLLAPIAWSLRGDGNGVDAGATGGAAAIVNFDADGDASPSESSSTSPAVVIVADATLAPVASSPAPTTVAGPVCASRYVVQPGDSWYLIAERAGVSPGLIAGSNGVTTQASLMVGQEICLPPGAVTPTAPPQDSSADENVSAQEESSAAPACGLDYVVQAGDSWFGIAGRAGVKAGPLAAANGMTIRSSLKVGQTICLPVGAKRPAPTTTTTQAPAPATTGSSGGSSRPTLTGLTYNPAYVYSRSELEQMIRDVWPDELEEQALYVVQRESRFNTTSYNWCCVGLFQVNWWSHRSWMQGVGVSEPSQLMDPLTNVRMALVVWQRSGSWRPWCTASWCPEP